MLHCSNFVLLEFNPFSDVTFNLDFRMLHLCFCCSIILWTIFQVVIWICVWGLSFFVFQSHKTLHVEDATRTQHMACARYFVAALFKELAYITIREMWGLESWSQSRTSRSRSRSRLLWQSLGLCLVSKCEPGLGLSLVDYGLDYITEGQV